MDTTPYKPKELRLRQVPEDVYKTLLRVQGEIKESCNCQFSLEQTIYRLIRKAVKEENGPAHNT